MRPAAVALAVALVHGVVGAAAGEVESFLVEPGTEFLLVEDHRAPVVFLRVEFPAGSWSPWFARNHGEEAFEIQLHDPAGELRSRADGLAAGIDLVVGHRASTLYASCLSEDLDALVALVRDVLENPEFDRSELTRRKHERRLGWKAALREPFFRWSQAASRALFAAGDPRRLDWEEPAALETRPERLLATRNALVRLPGRVVALAGDVTRERAAALAGSLLPGLSAEVPPDLAPRWLLAADGPREIVVTLPRLSQAYFGVARTAPALTDSDYPAFAVADHVLGGHFWSRLSVALRHEEGRTYGAWTRHEPEVVPVAWAALSFTASAEATAAQATLASVLERLAREGIDEDERASAAGWLTGRRAFERQSPAALLDRALAERRLGLPLGSFDRIAEQAAAVPLETIHAFGRRFFDATALAHIEVVPAR